MDTAKTSSARTSNFEFDSDLLFSHPDNTPQLDALRDPVAQVAAGLYELGPVVRGRGVDGGTQVEFGGFTFPNVLIPAHLCRGEVFAVVSWEAHRQMYMNAKVFSSRLFEETVRDFWGPALTPMDAPEHTKYRTIMQRGFTPRHIKTYEDTLIRPVLARRLSAIRENRRADLAREIHAYYPYEIVGGIAGFDPSDVQFVAACFNRIFQFNTDPQAAVQAGIALRDYTHKLVLARREDPREDVLSAMLEAEVGGEKLPDEHLIGMTNHLMAGGVDTTYKQSGNLIHALLSNPDQLQLLRENRDLIPNAIEESLRYEGVGGITGRWATEDTELMGVCIPEGSVVFTLHGVANRDPDRWPDPNRFDIRRERKAHMQFANGPHMCIGQHLARMMLGHYLTIILNDFPNIRFDPDLETPPKITGWTQRSPLSLPVAWDTN